MANDMAVTVELWPIAADELSIWLLSDGAWTSPNVQSDSEPHTEVEALAREHLGEDAAPDLYHSTSWRTDGQHVVLTYVAAFTPAGEHVRGTWREALPISIELFREAGKPIPTGATEAPIPRYSDVLFHAIRHLRLLADTDTAAKNAMSPVLLKHLRRWKPALAGMYRTDAAS